MGKELVKLMAAGVAGILAEVVHWGPITVSTVGRLVAIMLLVRGANWVIATFVPTKTTTTGA